MPGIHFRLGRAIMQSSKETNAVEQAVHEFELELEISPDNSDAEYEIGEIYRRSEEHTSELQSQSNLVCRLLLEKKKNNSIHQLHRVWINLIVRELKVEFAFDGTVIVISFKNVCSTVHSSGTALLSRTLSAHSVH